MRVRSATVSIKLALLTVHATAVRVAVGRELPHRLPFIASDSGDLLDHQARMLLQKVTGTEQAYIEQLYTFSFDARTEGQVVVSYLALAPSDTNLGDTYDWVEQANAFPLLGSPDQLVLEYGLIRLRAKIGYTTIAFHLMPESFTLGELQQTYESILSRPLDPRNFRRRMVSSGLLEAENRLRREGKHRPAALYRFSGAHDPASYLTPLAGTLDPVNGAQPR